MKDLRCVLMLFNHRNYTLAPDFTAFTVPHAVWQVKSQQDKDVAFGKFLAHTVRQKRTCDGNIKQRSAVCASEAKHCQKAGPWKVHMH